MFAEDPSPIDISLSRQINQRCTSPLLDFTMPLLTLLGLGGVQLPLVGLVWWAHGGAGAAATLPSVTVAAFLLSTVLVHALKRKIRRKRPASHSEVRFLVPTTRQASFPSGHTTTSFALAVVVAWHFPLWTVPLLVMAGLVGYSRVYVGVHFLSDVAAAAAIGMASAAATIAWLG
jgi:undecaprenyl-diphosphatase